MSRVSTSFAALLLASGCATTPFVPTGTLELNGTSASFNQTEVVGPNVQVRRTTEGSWVGLIYDQPVDVTVTGDTLRGANLQLIQERWPDFTRISGLWFNSFVKVEMTASRMRVEVAGNGAEYVRLPDGSWQGTSAAIPYALHLGGEAAGMDRPWPQFALALIGTGTNATKRRMLPGPAPKMFFGSSHH